MNDLVSSITTYEVAFFPTEYSKAYRCAPGITPPIHGVVSCTSVRDVGSRCYYSCKTRYELQGGSEMICERSGVTARWTGTKPRCTSKYAYFNLWFRYGSSESNIGIP